MSNEAQMEALGIYWNATQLDPQLRECFYQHLNRIHEQILLKPG